MLATIGVGSLDALLDQAVPANIGEPNPLTLGAGRSEVEVTARLRELADQNEVFTSLIGTGYYGTITPPVIRRNVVENPAWYTAYTPYQPEISQGRLEALFNFQTVISDLTGLELANASMLDEATAAAEAMTLLHRVAGGDEVVFLVDADCHPQTRSVVETRAEPLGLEDRHARSRSAAPRPGGRLRCTAAVPRFVGPGARPARHHRPAARPSGAGGGGHRPPRPHTADPARPHGGRRGRRVGPALRGADGVRRPPRRLPRHPVRASPLPARTAGGPVGRRRRPTGVAARAPDPRATHPPREGHLQHLHGTGAPGQHRRAVRVLARPRRAHRHRSTRPRPHP